MDWKDVFDGSKKHWASIDDLMQFVFNSGYLYFTWNDFVYAILGNTVYRTNELVRNLQ